jgi:hypothetical protein
MIASRVHRAILLDGQTIVDAAPFVVVTKQQQFH